MSDDRDLEKCTTGYQVSMSSDASRQCAIAVQHSDGGAVLINATIKEEVNGYLVLSSAKKQFSQALTKGWHQRLIAKLFMHFVVGTARIKQVPFSLSGKRFGFATITHMFQLKTTHCGQRPHYSPGYQRPPISPPRVYLQDFALDPLLTEALHDPRILFCPTDHTGYERTHFTNDIDEKRTSTCMQHEHHPDFIVIRCLLDRTKVARLLILLLFLSPALGISVGVCFQNADMGIAISAGLFGLTTFVQGLVAWVQG